jgi:hypothetical protein
VDRLDDTHHPQPEALTVNETNQLSRLSTVVSQTFASWNQLSLWLRQLADLSRPADRSAGS